MPCGKCGSKMRYKGRFTVASSNPMFIEPFNRDNFPQIPNARKNEVRKLLHDKMVDTLRYEIIVMQCPHCFHLALLDAEFPVSSYKDPNWTYGSHKTKCQKCDNMFISTFSAVTKQGLPSKSAKKYCDDCLRDSHYKYDVSKHLTDEEKALLELQDKNKKKNEKQRLSKYTKEAKAVTKKAKALEIKSFENYLTASGQTHLTKYHHRTDQTVRKKVWESFEAMEKRKEKRKPKFTEKDFDEMPTSVKAHIRRKLLTDKWKHCVHK